MVSRSATTIINKSISNYHKKVCNPLPFAIRAASNNQNTSSSTTSATKPPLCDVIQGPSLLRTPVSRPNPTLMFLPGLRSVPFWTLPDYSRIAYGDPTLNQIVQYLESHVDTIRQEYLQVAPGLPSDYEGTDHGGSTMGSSTSVTDMDSNADTATTTATTLHKGKWEWHSYMNKGNVQGHFAFSFPQTARILQNLRDDGLLFEGTPFGFSFFSTLYGGASIQSHTAPTNLRLRIHLPLIVPTENDNEDDKQTIGCGIRVGNLARPWTNGKALILDDSYDHQVWNNTKETRVLLLVDVWHPDISVPERKEIVQLFQTAREQGLWKR